MEESYGRGRDRVEGTGKIEEGKDSWDVEVVGAGRSGFLSIDLSLGGFRYAYVFLPAGFELFFVRRRFVLRSGYVGLRGRRWEAGLFFPKAFCTRWSEDSRPGVGWVG